MNFLDKRVNEILAKAAENIIAEAKANLKDGTLKNSLRAEEGDDNSIEIIMAKYGVFQDKGVTGANHSNFKGKKKEMFKSLAGYKFNPSNRMIGGSENILKWMKKNKIKGRDKKTGRYIKQETASFMIRRSIHHHGIKPSLFLTTPYEKYMELIKKEFLNLHNEIIKDITNGSNR